MKEITIIRLSDYATNNAKDLNVEYEDIVINQRVHLKENQIISIDCDKPKYHKDPARQTMSTTLIYEADLLLNKYDFDKATKETR